MREDFVGPLRDGIDQYVSQKGGKNFNVRAYENVRSLGPRLSPQSGIVYDLCLERNMASKISWANSRRLMYGNLLVLTYDGFRSCVFVTVEDRKNIETDFIVAVNFILFCILFRKKKNTFLLIMLGKTFRKYQYE